MKVFSTSSFLTYIALYFFTYTEAMKIQRFTMVGPKEKTQAYRLVFGFTAYLLLASLK